MHELLLLTAKYLYLVVGLIAFVYWLTVKRAEKIRLVVFAAIAGIATFALVKLGAALFYDTRPFIAQHITPLYPHGSDNGFPSDHTALTAFAALVMFSSSKRIGSVLLGMSLLIGLSRVLGHIHAPVDIVGSLVIALLGFGLANWLTPVIQRRYLTK